MRLKVFDLRGFRLVTRTEGAEDGYVSAPFSYEENVFGNGLCAMSGAMM